MERAPTDERSAGETMSTTAGPKIVVVDDSRVVLDLVTETLLKEGYEVIAVSNPFGFSNLLRREQPQLALVDVTMPALLGTQLVEIAVRAGGHDCRIVLFSDRPVIELAAMAQKCGADGFLQKDGDMRKLIQSVRTILRK
jgi:DNA-binding response OmpR family regulator